MRCRCRGARATGTKRGVRASSASATRYARSSSGGSSSLSRSSARCRCSRSRSRSARSCASSTARSAAIDSAASRLPCSIFVRRCSRATIPASSFAMFSASVGSTFSFLASLPEVVRMRPPRPHRHRSSVQRSRSRLLFRVVRRVLAILICAALLAPAAALAADPPPEVSLNWVGDISFSERQGLPPGGPSRVLSKVRKYLQGADITTGNLEGTLGRGGPSKCSGGGSNCFAFQAPASYARALARVGFDLFNLANNHSLDFGASGLRQTLRALRAAGLRHTGLVDDIRYVTIAGTRVAFLGFAPYPWASPLTDIGAARRQIASAARRADIVVVFLPAGAEGAGETHTPHGREFAFGENRGAARRFAHSAIRAGADAILGSGPHVLRGMECYRRRVIAYSLGNFVGYRTLATGGVLSLSGVLRLRLGPAGALTGGRLFRVRLAPPGVPEPGGGSVGLVRRLSRADFGARACRISRKGEITLP